jgi:Zn-dependent metalloprotease
VALDAQEVKRHFRCSHVPGKGRCLHDLERNIQTFDFEFRSVEMESILLPGQAVMSQGDAETWDPAAVSAHANAAEVIDFLETVLLRKGIDDAGGPLISSINCVRGIGAREWRNAAWISTQMIYGQRLLNGEMCSYAISRDVVAHEIFHGVTEHTARLDCWGESGALNESYSDVFAILVTNHENPDVATWNWEIGEELDCTGLPLRDLANPEKYGHPAHAGDYQGLPVTLEGDWGGVHVNSTIHSKVAHVLLTARKGKKNLFSPTTVAKLFYLTLTEHLARTSGFSDSRRGMELVARSLFRGDKNKKEKVAVIASVFDEVGIEA